MLRIPYDLNPTVHVNQGGSTAHFLRIKEAKDILTDPRSVGKISASIVGADEVAPLTGSQFYCMLFVNHILVG